MVLWCSSALASARWACIWEPYPAHTGHHTAFPVPSCPCSHMPTEDATCAAEERGPAGQVPEGCTAGDHDRAEGTSDTKEGPALNLASISCH